MNKETKISTRVPGSGASFASERSAGKIKLDSFDDLFGSNDEQIVEIPLEDFVHFKNHPFKIRKNEEMDALVASIKEHGVLVPGIARLMSNGKYELISGHQRCTASGLAGLSTMPVFVKELSDDEAVLIMVDSNIQRENLLFSEKAFAYKMKFEALKHTGSKGVKGSTEEIGEELGESARQVQRYIRLTELLPELLDMVDEKKIGFVAAVDLSYLKKKEQKLLLLAMKELSLTPSGTQASLLKKYSDSGELNSTMIELVLSDEKPKKRKLTIKADRINQYFSEEYDDEEIENIIYQLLDEWKKNQ